MKQELRFRERGVGPLRALEIMTWAAQQPDQSLFYLTIQNPSMGMGSENGPYDINLDFKDNDEIALEFKLLFCEEV